MTRFSERLGIATPRVDLQIDSMDGPLRTCLWNQVDVFLLRKVHPGGWPDREGLPLVLAWLHLWKLPLDTLPRFWDEARRTFRHRFFEVPWNEVYDFVEFLAQRLEQHRNDFREGVNVCLEREMAGYRLVEGELVRVVDPGEIEAVTQALNASATMKGVRLHLEAALSMLSDRSAPDYRNSIKEAISAVEAMCRLIIGNPAATLSEALKRLKAHGLNLHPAMEKGWLSIYGFTSDAGGIRHALSGESEITFADAKYMVVVCSAFVNHLILASQQAGISLQAADIA